MSVKLALLKTGDTIISDIKEIKSEDSLMAYLFNKPHKAIIQKEILLTESETITGATDREYQVLLSPWIILSQDDDIVITPDWIVTIVEPVSSIKQLYGEKINGTSD